MTCCRRSGGPGERIVVLREDRSVATTVVSLSILEQNWKF